jgi:hypothetical protein
MAEMPTAFEVCCIADLKLDNSHPVLSTTLSRFDSRMLLSDGRFGSLVRRMEYPIFSKRQPAPDKENQSRQSKPYQSEIEDEYVKHWVS